MFQENFNRVKKHLNNKDNIVLHDCITNACQWNSSDKTESFVQSLDRLGSKDVVFVDSLAHVIHQYGLPVAYKIFNNVKTRTSKLNLLCSRKC